MRPTNAILVAVACCPLLAVITQAQTSAVYLLTEPKTKLEAIEGRTGVVLIKATAPIGTITTSKGVLSVTCKENQAVGPGLKEYGISIGITAGDKPQDTLLLDYDELDALLNAVDYLNKVDWTVTSLPSFSAAYETKGGLRVAVFISKRSGTIEIAVRNTNAGNAPILLTREQFAQFRLLIEQSKEKLDALIKEHQSGEPQTNTDGRGKL